MELKNVNKRCDSCVKRLGRYECKVLLEKIGENKDCWAYSNDKHFFRKTEKAIEKYGKNWRII